MEKSVTLEEALKELRSWKRECRTSGGIGVLQKS